MAEFLTQLQLKNNDLESRDRQNEVTISRLKKTLDEQEGKHQTALAVQASSVLASVEAHYQMQVKNLVDAHDAQMNQQRLEHEKEIIEKSSQIKIEGSNKPFQTYCLQPTAKILNPYYRPCKKRTES